MILKMSKRIIQISAKPSNLQDITIPTQISVTRTIRNSPHLADGMLHGFTGGANCLWMQAAIDFCGLVGLAHVECKPVQTDYITVFN